MFLTQSCKSYAKVLNSIVNYALINTTFSSLLLFFLLLVLDIRIYSRSASTVLSECNRQVSELLCQLSLCHLGERNVPSKLLWLGWMTFYQNDLPDQIRFARSDFSLLPVAMESNCCVNYLMAFSAPLNCKHVKDGSAQY